MNFSENYLFVSAETVLYRSFDSTKEKIYNGSFSIETGKTGKFFSDTVQIPFGMFFEYNNPDMLLGIYRLKYDTIFYGGNSIDNSNFVNMDIIPIFHESFKDINDNVYDILNGNEFFIEGNDKWCLEEYYELKNKNIEQCLKEITELNFQRRNKKDISFLLLDHFFKLSTK